MIQIPDSNFAHPNKNAKILMIDALVGNDYSLLLCDQLYKSGIDVTLVTTKDREINIPVSLPILRWVPSKNPKISRLKKALGYVVYLARLCLCAIRGQFDVFHFQFFRFERIESVLMVFLKMTGVRLVHTAHNVFPHERKSGDHFVKAMIYRSSTQILVHSETVKRRLAQAFGISVKKISVIPHGNFDVYRARVAISKSSACNCFGLKPENPVVLFFGFIREYKGLDILLEAFDIAYRQNPLLRLLIAGQCQTRQMEDNYKNRIRSMVSREGIVFHPGFVAHEKISTYFMAVDWVALPYRHIDHSGLIHLAYAYGKPVIATDVMGLSDMIAEDGTGYLAPVNDPGKLAEIIIHAVSDPAVRDQMGARGEHLSKTKYTWANAVNLTRQVYEDAVALG